ncbi:MAG: hypothetical protein Q8N77_02085 [Nanoarchaeota archaeon]|nr:hypothetical protein [Nanoarchaeota archaeon]
MNIDDIANENVRFCKETGKQITDGKCVCSGKPVEKECKCTNGCHESIDLGKLAPFLIYLSKFYKGPNQIVTE